MIAVGTEVIIKHQPELNDLIVSNAWDTIEPIDVLGKIVTGYVRVTSISNPHVKDWGYHMENIEIKCQSKNE